MWSAFNIAKNLKYNGYQHGPASMVQIFLLKSQKAVLLDTKLW